MPVNTGFPIALLFTTVKDEINMFGVESQCIQAP